MCKQTIYILSLFQRFRTKRKFVGFTCLWHTAQVKPRRFREQKIYFSPQATASRTAKRHPKPTAFAGVNLHVFAEMDGKKVSGTRHFLRTRHKGFRGGRMGVGKRTTAFVAYIVSSLVRHLRNITATSVFTMAARRRLIRYMCPELSGRAVRSGWAVCRSGVH